MNGWTGTILRINLTTGAVTKQPTDMHDAALFLGARGLGVKILTDEVDPKVDPLSAENKLIFAPGPFTGTMAPSAGRYHVVAKSPLTNAIGGANSGGVFGAAMKYAGYDALIFEGKAEKPVYVWIKDDHVEIRDAAHLWGKWVPDTTDAVRDETDADAAVACIGPAGEKLVLFASIQNEMHRSAGRGGMGAVMGSKNLKAVAFRGTKGVGVADVKALTAAIVSARAKLAVNPIAQGLGRFGTEVLVNILNEIGSLPTRNSNDGYFPTADKVGGESLSKEYLDRKKGCFSCVISCGRVSSVKDPKKFAGEGEGPEYEAGWGYGPDCGIDDLAAVTKANHLCNELGLDAISTPTTIACAIDLAESGLLPKEDLDGLDIRWGNPDLIVELTKRIGLRQGIGDKLALGSYRFAELYGHPEYSMSVKKQETPAYDARGVQGIGLQYATCNRGGCHVKGYTIAVEVLGNGVRLDPRETKGKPAVVKAFQDVTAAVDASGGCIFGTFGMVPDDFAAMLSALTGVHYSPEDYVKAGERIWNLEREFNLKAGFTAKDDTLPERMLKTPIKTGPSKGLLSHVPEMLPEYYSLRGWSEQGVPTAEKLHELQLA